MPKINIDDAIEIAKTHAKELRQLISSLSGPDTSFCLAENYDLVETGKMLATDINFYEPWQKLQPQAIAGLAAMAKYYKEVHPEEVQNFVDLIMTSALEDLMQQVQQSSHPALQDLIQKEQQSLQSALEDLIQQVQQSSHPALQDLIQKEQQSLQSALEDLITKERRSPNPDSETLTTQENVQLIYNNLKKAGKRLINILISTWMAVKNAKITAILKQEKIKPISEVDAEKVEKDAWQWVQEKFEIKIPEIRDEKEHSAKIAETAEVRNTAEAELLKKFLGVAKETVEVPKLDYSQLLAALNRDSKLGVVFQHEEQQEEAQEEEQQQQQQIVEEDVEANLCEIDLAAELATKIERSQGTDNSAQKSILDFLYALSPETNIRALHPNYSHIPTLSRVWNDRLQVLGCEKVSENAAKKIKKYIHELEDGINPDNLPAGFFLGVDNDGRKILQFDVFLKVREGKLNETDFYRNPQVFIDESMSQVKHVNLSILVDWEGLKNRCSAEGIIFDERVRTTLVSEEWLKKLNVETIGQDSLKLYALLTVLSELKERNPGLYKNLTQHFVTTDQLLELCKIENLQKLRAMEAWGPEQSTWWCNLVDAHFNGQSKERRFTVFYDSFESFHEDLDAFWMNLYDGKAFPFTTYLKMPLGKSFFTALSTISCMLKRSCYPEEQLLQFNEATKDSTGLVAWRNSRSTAKLFYKFVPHYFGQNGTDEKLQSFMGKVYECLPNAYYPRYDEAKKFFNSLKTLFAEIQKDEDESLITMKQTTISIAVAILWHRRVSSSNLQQFIACAQNGGWKTIYDLPGIMPIFEKKTVYGTVKVEYPTTLLKMIVGVATKIGCVAGQFRLFLSNLVDAKLATHDGQISTVPLDSILSSDILTCLCCAKELHSSNVKYGTAGAEGMWIRTITTEGVDTVITNQIICDNVTRLARLNPTVVAKYAAVLSSIDFTQEDFKIDDLPTFAEIVDFIEQYTASINPNLDGLDRKIGELLPKINAAIAYRNAISTFEILVKELQEQQPKLQQGTLTKIKLCLERMPEEFKRQSELMEDLKAAIADHTFNDETVENLRKIKLFDTLPEEISTFATQLKEIPLSPLTVKLKPIVDSLEASADIGQLQSAMIQAQTKINDLIDHEISTAVMQQKLSEKYKNIHFKIDAAAATKMLQDIPSKIEGVLELYSGVFEKLGFGSISTDDLVETASKILEVIKNPPISVILSGIIPKLNIAVGEKNKETILEILFRMLDTVFGNVIANGIKEVSQAKELLKNIEIDQKLTLKAALSGLIKNDADIGVICIHIDEISLSNGKLLANSRKLLDECGWLRNAIEDMSQLVEQKRLSREKIGDLLKNITKLGDSDTRIEAGKKLNALLEIYSKNSDLTEGIFLPILNGINGSIDDELLGAVRYLTKLQNSSRKLPAEVFIKLLEYIRNHKTFYKEHIDPLIKNESLSTEVLSLAVGCLGRKSIEINLFDSLKSLGDKQPDKLNNLAQLLLKFPGFDNPLEWKDDNFVTIQQILKFRDFIEVLISALKEDLHQAALQHGKPQLNLQNLLAIVQRINASSKQSLLELYKRAPRPTCEGLLKLLTGVE